MANLSRSKPRRKSRIVKIGTAPAAPLRIPPSKPRDPVARSPLLRKGGVHQKSEQARRKAAKDELAKKLRRGED